jgi:hypothetical protein
MDAGVGMRSYVSCVTDCPARRARPQRKLAIIVGLLRDVAPVRGIFGRYPWQRYARAGGAYDQAVLNVAPVETLPDIS